MGCYKEEARGVTCSRTYLLKEQMRQRGEEAICRGGKQTRMRGRVHTRENRAHRDNSYITKN